MLIEIWSDVVCPWCYIGKRRLEAALADFEHRDEVEVVYRSFELDPSAPEVGTESIGEALARKYGGGPAETRAAMDRVAAMAAEVGLELDYADATHTRTLDAHRLLHLALDEGGPSSSAPWSRRSSAAYFTRGRSMGDRDVLREVALGAGLRADRVDAVLTSEEYAEQVSADSSRPGPTASRACRSSSSTAVSASPVRSPRRCSPRRCGRRTTPPVRRLRRDRRDRRCDPADVDARGGVASAGAQRRARPPVRRRFTTA